MPQTYIRTLLASIGANTSVSRDRELKMRKVMSKVARIAARQRAATKCLLRNGVAIVQRSRISPEQEQRLHRPIPA
jgi:hypothetical protein